VGAPLRTLQEWLGHRDFTTTLIYADYASNPHEAELVELAFNPADRLGVETEQGIAPSKTRG
jgi:site-specific recombinase XerC